MQHNRTTPTSIVDDWKENTQKQKALQNILLSEVVSKNKIKTSSSGRILLILLKMTSTNASFLFLSDAKHTNTVCVWGGGVMKKFFFYETKLLQQLSIHRFKLRTF